MTTPVEDPNKMPQLADAVSATFTISVWIPILALMLTAIGLAYTIWRAQTG